MVSKANMTQSKKPLLMIIDDNQLNIETLTDYLEPDYAIHGALTGPDALSSAPEIKPDLILLDIMMPFMDGFEICRKLKNDPVTSGIPIIFITGKGDEADIAQGFELGAVDYITKPFHMPEIHMRINHHLNICHANENIKQTNIQLERQVEKKNADIKQMLCAAISAMSQMFENNDPSTAGHQQRVAKLASDIAREMHLSDDQIEAIRIAGLLHDIGKIRIPDTILSRPGPLLPSEYELIRIHPQVGYDLVKHIPFPWPVAEFILQHHEKLNGSGYPYGLKRDDIHLESKIICVADVAEAMTSHRPYRPALGIDIAEGELLKTKYSV
ncbi:MAG: two-component system response regulator [Candidatus Magnetoglobus multicellularis str. Araruama]|uniref:Two-component system response regulator n=1 Tax=Candidatus Magnetoglobus multicellularis str. Araruama TaxID=890399 RepID=A0A1V1P996_9BACT|nr:MAG: two-component system response regulator [Candidatus Magnetoglobus multicellularis str. Araruama]